MNVPENAKMTVFHAGANASGPGTEVVGNPKAGDEMVLCSKREWRAWVHAVDAAQSELDAMEAEGQRRAEALAEYLSAVGEERSS